MWFIAGEHSSLSASFASCLQRNKIAFSSIRTTCHPDGEMQFDWPAITPSSQHVLLQLQSPYHTYTSALSLSREIQAKMHQAAIRCLSELIICLPYMPYARNPYLLDVMLSSVISHQNTQTALPCYTNVHFVALDIHNSHDPRICNLYPAKLFAEQIITFTGGHENCFVFAPDRGATWRAHKIAKELHAPVIVANKMRRKDHSCDIQIMSCGDEFDINECLKTRDFCILVDDIVASGETLRAAVSCIKNIGTKHIIAVITHTVIAPVWPLLNDIDAWITTNTFPSSAQFTIVDIAPFIVSAITNRT